MQPLSPHLSARRGSEPSKSEMSTTTATTCRTLRWYRTISAILRSAVAWGKYRSASGTATPLHVCEVALVAVVVLVVVVVQLSTAAGFMLPSHPTD